MALTDLSTLEIEALLYAIDYTLERDDDTRSSDPSALERTQALASARARLEGIPGVHDPDPVV